MKWNYNLSDIDIQDDEIKNVLEVVRSKWLSTGPVTDQFEKKISEFLGVEHVTSVFVLQKFSASDAKPINLPLKNTSVPDSFCRPESLNFFNTLDSS